MAYAILTHDDVVGMIPTLSVLLFLGYGMYKCLAFIWRQCSSVVKLVLTARTSASSKTQDNTGSLTSSSKMNPSANASTHTTSVIFLLLLSYLLSPLSSMLHLRGFRISPRNRRNSNNNNNKNIQPHELQHHQFDHNLHDLVYGEDPKLTEVLALTPSLLRGPQPPLFLTNRHLQFIPWLIQNELHRVEGIPFQRLHLRVNACVDKSHGTDHCERSPLMDDTVTLDVFPPFDNDDEDNMDNRDSNNNHNSTSSYGRFHAGSPIVFFSPGLRCYSQDMPGNMIIRRLYGEGFRSVVVNRRGHTPDQKLQAPRWNLFGDVDDLEQVYWHIQREWAAPHTPFFLHGISSGTSVVVSALAEYDRRRYYLQQQQQQEQSPEAADTAPTTLLPRAAPSFVASISITPGYDISKVMLPDRFKYPYNPVMLDAVKTHFVRDNEQILRAFDSDAVDAALAATHLQQFVDAVAPFAGYPNATEYYKGENPVNWMHFVSTPSLVLNAIDDPCCHVHNIYEQSPYPQHRGRSYATLIDESPRGILAVAKSGSHCPFLDASSKTLRLLPAFIKDPLYGGWMLDSWADRVSIEFYKASLKVYEERR